MKQITYLVGAGASAACLPVIWQLPNRLKNQLEFLGQDCFVLDASKFDISDKFTKRDIQLMLLEDLNWLFEQTYQYTSVDTYAKKLLLRKDINNLNRLKVALCVFFIIEQLRNIPDQRYDAFYAGILHNLWEFPTNLKVVSWNYDMQFEPTYSEYAGEEARTGNTSFRVVSKFSRSEASNDQFTLFKLNGNTVLLDTFREYSFLDGYGEGPTKKRIEQVVRNYGITRITEKNLHIGLSFAWEEETSKNNVVQKTIAGVRDTEILVVIGYSFPFFNRNVDRAIINSMKSLQKVYIQDFEPNAVIERFEAVYGDIRGLKIVPRNDVSQFLIPYEF